MVNESRYLIRVICQRKNWVGQVLRRDGLLKDMLEERMLGKKRQGRPRTGLMNEHMKGSFEK